MSEAQEISDMTTTEIEERLRGGAETQNEPAEEETRLEGNEEQSQGEVGYQDTYEQRNPIFDSILQKQEAIEGLLKSRGYSANAAEQITEEMLAKNPIGTIQQLAEKIARQIVAERTDPIYQEMNETKSNKAWNDFSDNLKKSGIEITQQLDTAIAEEIRKLPKQLNLTPNEILEFAYYKASKRVKVAPKQKVEEANKERAHVEGSKSKSRTPAPNIDPAKMPLKDLERMIGKKEERFY